MLELLQRPGVSRVRDISAAGASGRWISMARRRARLSSQPAGRAIPSASWPKCRGGAKTRRFLAASGAGAFRWRERRRGWRSTIPSSPGPPRRSRPR
eukprot:7371007-Pyramimonas_sp.AAC.1